MEIRTLRASELEQAWELDRDAFHSPVERKQGFLRWDPERLVGAFDGDRLVALSGTIPFGQFFGGRSVPMGGLSSVSVAADRRGEGLARQVVMPCLEAMRERGEVISSLYPATTSLYRSLGWEAAGSVVWRSVVPRTLQGLPAPGSGRVRPGSEGDRDAIRACYARFARGSNGMIDRSDGWWSFYESDPEQSVYVAEDATGEVAGYLVYRQRDGEYSGMGGPFRLAVSDFVWNSPEAGLGLWRLLASWSTQVERVHYRSAAEDAATLLLPEQDSEVLVDLRWMTRLVDVVGAVEARGFPVGLDVEVPLELHDALLPANEGRFVLHVHKGRGRLERGGPGGATLDAGALASLYTGWAASGALARAGRLSGGSADERGALDAAFAGPVPWLLDEF